MTKAIFATLLLGFIAVGAALHHKCQMKADGTRLAHPNDCTKFMVCEEHQIARISSCPAGLHYNRHLGECDFKTKAGCEWFMPLDTTDCVCDPLCCDSCGGTPVTSTTPTTPTSTSTLATPNTPPSTGTTTGTATPTPTVPTPTPTTPTPITTGTSTPTQTPTVPTPTVPTPGTGNCGNDLTVCANKGNNETFAYEGYCNKWVTCQAGCAQILECPNNLQWNGKDCDFPQNISPPCPWPTTPPSTGPSGISCTDQGRCANAYDGVAFVNADNANAYVVCQCNCPIAMKCPGSLVFNETSQVCAYPAGYGSDAELNITCANNSTICKGKDEGTLYTIEGSCDTFYKCNYGCAVVQNCPSGLHWDNTTQVCDYVANVKCPWPYTPPSGPNAGPSGIACPSGGRCVAAKEGATFNSNTSCGKYVICQCECEVEMDCPGGLYWNNTTGMCGYAASVDCVLTN